VGFQVVEELARRWGLSADHLECNSLVGGGADGRPWLARPQTYMNRSGYAARCLLERHELAPEEILVVYDEVNLPLGRLRLRRSGSPAGHRGLESILENLRTDQVPRLRLGVAPEAGPPSGEGLPDFVLGPFAKEEEETATAMVLRAADACEVWASEGVEAAMNRFNG
jgi:PTH1 family peptidyl-tRNA hydrolase